MRLTASSIAASALGLLLLAAPLAGQGAPLDAFRANIAAIHARDRAAYLSHYLQTPALARVGPDGLHQGYEEFARGAGAGWPDTLVATHFRIVPVTPEVAYGVYRYRVVDSSGSVRGVSERVLVRTPAGWKVAVTTAFPTPDAAPPPIAIVGATLVDGTAAAAVPNAVVVLRECGIATPTSWSKQSCTPDPNGSSAPICAAASPRSSTWVDTPGPSSSRSGRPGAPQPRGSGRPDRSSRPSTSGSTCPTNASSSIWRTRLSSVRRYARTRRGAPRPSRCGTSCRLSRPTRRACRPWCTPPVTKLARSGCPSSCTRRGCGRRRTPCAPARAYWCTRSGRLPWTTSSSPSRGARERSTSRRSRCPTATARWPPGASRASDSP